MRITATRSVASAVLAIVLFALLGGTPSIAQELGQASFATMTAEHDVVYWDLLLENEGSVLTVAGPQEFYWTQEFSAGEKPWFSSRETVGSPLADGIYEYELQLTVGHPDGIGGPLEQSGELTILDGEFTVPVELEGGEAVVGETPGPEPLDVTPLDHVITDDLIVQGDACIGGGECANGETFGDDVLRIKATQIQVHFDDRSLGDYPKNDWRIHINENFENGDDYFSISDATASSHPFRIDAGAPTHALRITESGEIGMGTADPETELHIVASYAPAVYLEQVAPPYAWEVGASSSAFFIDDVTGGDTRVFRIKPGAAGNSLHLGEPGTDGVRVGMGTNDPQKELHISDGNTPTIRLDQDGSDIFAVQVWDLSGHAGSFSIRDVTNGLTSPFVVYTGAPSDSLVVGSGGNVGLGTNSPDRDLHIVSGNTPSVRLEQDTSGGEDAQTWDIEAHEVFFSVEDASRGTVPFRIDVGAPTRSLAIAPSGNVGIGTFVPAEKLHMLGNDGLTKARVEENAASTAVRVLLTLSNNGGARMRFKNSNTGERWNFGMSPMDAFQITSVGAPEIAFELDAAGNLDIEGSLSEGSSREVKENFRMVTGGDILAAVAELPISTWNYVADPPRVRHMGPMAEDFYAMFGLGADDEHISPLDANGVALAAIQGLHELSREQSARIGELEEQVANLVARLAALEEALG